MKPIIIKVSYYVEYVKSINNESALSKVFGSYKVRNQEGLIAIRTYAVDYHILEKVVRNNDKLQNMTIENLYAFLEKESPCEKINIINACKLEKDNSVKYTTSYAKWFLDSCRKSDINPDDWYSAWYVHRNPTNPEIVHKVEIPVRLIQFRNYEDNEIYQVSDTEACNDKLKQYRDKVKEQEAELMCISDEMNNMLKSVFQPGSITYNKFVSAINETVTDMETNIDYLNEAERLYESKDDNIILEKHYLEIIEVNQGLFADMDILRKKILEIKLSRMRKTNSNNTLKELIHDCESYI